MPGGKQGKGNQDDIIGREGGGTPLIDWDGYPNLVPGRMNSQTIKKDGAFRPRPLLLLLSKGTLV